MRNIVVIGGGTGTFTVLSGLKKYPFNLTAIVSMADSGGSNRVLRDEFGLLPTSDIRQCLVALTNTNNRDDLWRKLFIYRFDKGIGISGMTFGNLFMAALTDILGSQKRAIEKTSEILNIKGKVLPVTYDDIHLVATYTNKTKVIGEHFIDEPKKEKTGYQRIVNLETIPEAKANKEALMAIKEAEAIILGPGDLYTSVICNLIIKGLAEAIDKSKAKVVYILNLMTKFGQTYKLGAEEHVYEIERYLKTYNPKPKMKRNRRINFVLINNGRIPKKILRKYWREEKAEPVVDNLKETMAYHVIRKNLISSHLVKRVAGDNLKRSLIRHDSQKLAKVIVSLL